MDVRDAPIVARDLDAPRFDAPAGKVRGGGCAEQQERGGKSIPSHPALHHPIASTMSAAITAGGRIVPSAAVWTVVQRPAQPVAASAA